MEQRLQTIACRPLTDITKIDLPFKGDYHLTFLSKTRAFTGCSGYHRPNYRSCAAIGYMLPPYVVAVADVFFTFVYGET